MMRMGFSSGDGNLRALGDRHAPCLVLVMQPTTTCGAVRGGRKGTTFCEPLLAVLEVDRVDIASPGNA